MKHRRSHHGVPLQRQEDVWRLVVSLLSTSDINLVSLKRLVIVARSLPCCVSYNPTTNSTSWTDLYEVIANPFFSLDIIHTLHSKILSFSVVLECLRNVDVMPFVSLSNPSVLMDSSVLFATFKLCFLIAYVKLCNSRTDYQDCSTIVSAFESALDILNQRHVENNRIEFINSCVSNRFPSLMLAAIDRRLRFPLYSTFTDIRGFIETSSNYIFNAYFEGALMRYYTVNIAKSAALLSSLNGGTSIDNTNRDKHDSKYLESQNFFYVVSSSVRVIISPEYSCFPDILHPHVHTLATFRRSLPWHIFSNSISSILITLSECVLNDFGVLNDTKHRILSAPTSDRLHRSLQLLSFMCTSEIIKSFDLTVDSNLVKHIFSLLSGCIETLIFLGSKNSLFSPCVACIGASYAWIHYFANFRQSLDVLEVLEKSSHLWLHFLTVLEKEGYLLVSRPDAISAVFSSVIFVSPFLNKVECEKTMRTLLSLWRSEDIDLALQPVLSQGVLWLHFCRHVVREVVRVKSKIDIFDDIKILQCMAFIAHPDASHSVSTYPFRLFAAAGLLLGTMESSIWNTSPPSWKDSFVNFLVHAIIAAEKAESCSRDRVVVVTAISYCYTTLEKYFKSDKFIEYLPVVSSLGVTTVDVLFDGCFKISLLSNSLLSDNAMETDVISCKYQVKSHLFKESGRISRFLSWILSTLLSPDARNSIVQCPGTGPMLLKSISIFTNSLFSAWNCKSVNGMSLLINPHKTSSPPKSFLDLNPKEPNGEFEYVITLLSTVHIAIVHCMLAVVESIGIQNTNLEDLSIVLKLVSNVHFSRLTSFTSRMLCLKIRDAFLRLEDINDFIKSVCIRSVLPMDESRRICILMKDNISSKEKFSLAVMSRVAFYVEWFAMFFTHTSDEILSEEVIGYWLMPLLFLCINSNCYIDSPKDSSGGSNDLSKLGLSAESVSSIGHSAFAELLKSNRFYRLSVVPCYLDIALALHPVYTSLDALAGVVFAFFSSPPPEHDEFCKIFSGLLILIIQKIDLRITELRKVSLRGGQSPRHAPVPPLVALLFSLLPHCSIEILPFLHTTIQNIIQQNPERRQNLLGTLTKLIWSSDNCHSKKECIDWLLRL